LNKNLLHGVLILGLTLLLILLTVFSIPDAYAAKPTLYWGSIGSSVKLVQWKLSQWGYYNGAIDGVFQSQTWSAVRNFQWKNGLRVDGVVGPQTWAALGYVADSSNAVTASSYGVNRSDNVELLARLIHAEARGEPYEGQVAVGAVLLNRVENPSFPNSLSGVIYQPLAFESVSNGQFNLPATSDNYRAARSALNGWDPTYGAVFFWNPSKPVSSWIWSRQIVRSIGNHVFAY
jgi:N-acetylmuramoyl-L-alanine amidase